MKLKKPEQKIYSQSKFRRGKVTCPICYDVNDWACRSTVDGGLAYCSSVPNSSGNTDAHGRHQHILRRDSEVNVMTAAEKEGKAKSQRNKADADILHRVYTALLERLELSETHSASLLNERGLKDDTIARNLYATVPDRITGNEIANELAESFDLEGVPGFYKEDDGWKLAVTYPGFYVPYRDNKGRIIGIQIRTDGTEIPKYFWLSSTDKVKGVSSGAPFHHVNPDLGGDTTLYITEGALKADIIGDHLEVGLLAVAGVTSINGNELLATISSIFTQCQRIVLAFDMDWETNVNVHTALIKIVGRLLESVSHHVEIATWNRSFGKGLDDVILGGYDVKEVVSLISAEEFVTQSNSGVEIEIGLKSGASGIDEIDKNEINLKTGDNLNNDDVAYSWREFSNLKFPNVEPVIHGLVKGNVGMMVAPTNVGKTTLALNLALSVASQHAFLSLYESSHAGQRVLYIDGEATKAQLQKDIKKMIASLSPEQARRVQDNLFLICDEDINDEPLDLSNNTHMEYLLEKVMKSRPDLIIVDTLSALMEVEDENDNALIKKHVIKPLKSLAKLTNSAVLLLHHTGKYGEGKLSSGVNRGRGASTLGALSRVVFTLSRVKASSSQVVLSCPKVKGNTFGDLVLELDPSTRWFSAAERAVIENESKSLYQEVVGFVKDSRRIMHRKEVFKGMNADGTVIGDSTIGRHLKKAVEVGDLCSLGFGRYAGGEFCSKNVEAELPLAK